jgi:hypothetical protein
MSYLDKLNELKGKPVDDNVAVCIIELMALLLVSGSDIGETKIHELIEAISNLDEFQCFDGELIEETVYEAIHRLEDENVFDIISSISKKIPKDKRILAFWLSLRVIFVDCVINNFEMLLVARMVNSMRISDGAAYEILDIIEGK